MTSASNNDPRPAEEDKPTATEGSSTAGQSGAVTTDSVATGGTGSEATADAVEQSGDPGARGGYAEAVPGGSASHLAGEPSGTTASRRAEPFPDDSEPVDEDP
ncbi:MAG: hypothetical protein R2761_00800 [Acidimicrobiales bacterium]